MLKVTAPLVPFGVVTVIWLLGLAASPVIVNVAVICVVLVTLTFVTFRPRMLELTVVCPAMKLVPVSVTGNEVPATPLGGLIEVSVGGEVEEALTVKVTVPLVPPAVVTLTFCAPSGAFAAMAKVAVTWVAADVTLEIAMPFSALIVAPERFVPVRVTVLMV